LQTDKKMQERFNLDGCFDYFQMLKQQMSGEIDSWAIRWYWSVFKNNGFVVYPPTSYVNNIGFDGSGTHGSFLNRLFFKNVPEIKSSKIFNLPKCVTIKENEFNIIKIIIKKKNKMFLLKMKNFLKRLKYMLNF